MSEKKHAATKKEPQEAPKSPREKREPGGVPYKYLRFYVYVPVRMACNTHLVPEAQWWIFFLK